jgi:hypothetical protein
MKARIPTRRKPPSPRLRACEHAVALLLLLAPATLLAQELSVSSAAAARGGRVTLEISLKSPMDKAPVALQWETSIPAGQLSFLDRELAPGPALKDSDKSVNCAVKLTKSPDGSNFTSVCIASGGLKPIPNGVIALLNLQISPEARSGPQRLQVRGVAVSKDLKETPLREAQPVVTVGAK